MPGQLREKIGREDRWIAQGFAKGLDDLRKLLRRLTGAQNFMVMLCAVSTRNIQGIGGFVEAWFIESEGKGVQGPGGFPGGQGRERAGIHAAAEKNADGDIASELANHRIPEVAAKPLGTGFDGFCRAGRRKWNFPEGGVLLQATGAKNKTMTGLQLADIAIDGGRGGDLAEAEEGLYARGVDFRGDQRVMQEDVWRRGKDQFAAAGWRNRAA